MFGMLVLNCNFDNTIETCVVTKDVTHYTSIPKSENYYLIRKS